MKANFNLTRLGSAFGTLAFNEKSFFNTSLGFTPYWDYNPTNAIHADFYIPVYKPVIKIQI